MPVADGDRNPLRDSVHEAVWPADPLGGRSADVQRKTRDWGKTEETPPVAKFAGGVELLLWLSVMTAAIWIPNY